MKDSLKDLRFDLELIFLPKGEEPTSATMVIKNAEILKIDFNFGKPVPPGETTWIVPIVWAE